MEQLDVDIVPYIVLLVVPVLGRMSDPSDSIRFMATQCFATLIRLLPLEVRTSGRALADVIIYHVEAKGNIFSPFCPPGGYSRPSYHVS